MTQRVIGYARTSTTDQVAGLEDQIRELKAAGCAVEHIFQEQVSSVKERDQLDKALATLTEGDILMVTKPDRLARSTKQFLSIIEDLDRRKIGIIILSMGGQKIDSRSPTGKLILTVLASLAEFERSMMLVRQRPGIERARSEGKYKGAKPRSQERVDSVMTRKAAGMEHALIAKECGISESTVTRIVNNKRVRKINYIRPVPTEWVHPNCGVRM